MNKFLLRVYFSSLLAFGLVFLCGQTAQPALATQPFQEVKQNIQQAFPQNRGEIVTNFLATNAGTLISNATNQNQGDLLNNLEFPLLQTVRNLLPVVLIGSEVSLEQPTANMVIMAAQSATINAPVGGEVYALALSLNINAPVAGKVTAVTTQLKSNSPITIEVLSPFAVGKLLWQELDARRPVGQGASVERVNPEDYQATEGAELQSSSFIPSSLAKTDLSKWSLHIVKPVLAQESELLTESSLTEPAINRVDINWNAVNKTIQTGLATVLSLWALVFFLPRLIHDTNDSILNKPFSSVLWGIIGLIVIPVLAIMLLFTKIGLSVSLIMLLFYGMALLLSSWLVVFAIGKVVAKALQKKWSKMKWLNSPYIWVVVGVTIFSVLTNLPMVGGVVSLISFVVGFGALMLWTSNLRLNKLDK